MKVRRTELEGLLVIEPDLYSDNRGFFLETFRAEKYEEAGIPGPFLQDNLSYSVRGVIRGLHLQMPKPQGKLVHVVQGEVFDVSVDLRVGSPTFGRWVGYTLSGESKIQIYLPPGFAHGFIVTGESALFAYKCTEVFNPGAELTVRWNDPEFGIDWPRETPIISEKDATAPLLKEIDPKRLPRYKPPG